MKRGRDGRHRRVRECGRLCLSRHGERALCRPDIRACCLRSGRRGLGQRRRLSARACRRKRGRQSRHRRVRECRCLRFPIRLLLDLTGFASYFILTLQPRCVTVAARSRVWLLTSAPRSSTCQEKPIADALRPLLLLRRDAVDCRSATSARSSERKGGLLRIRSSVPYSSDYVRLRPSHGRSRRAEQEAARVGRAPSIGWAYPGKGGGGAFMWNAHKLP